MGFRAGEPVIRYCTRCVLPDTKPDLTLDADGVCSACRAYERRQNVDWDDRKRQLVEIIEKHRRPESGYDCIVPSSGGKDSHFQVLTILGLGFKPLVVTASTDHLTDLGRRNIENLKLQGVDYAEITCNPLVSRRLNKFCLETVGDISWPEHVRIFTVPVRLAVNYGIPLIIWGENSQNEYGGPAQAQENPTLDRRWLEEFGGLLGLRVSDLLATGDGGRAAGLDKADLDRTVAGFSASDLWIYTYPSQDELNRVGVTGLFLGYFVPWDGWRNALIAQAHGFETYPHFVEGSLANYENLDNAQTGIHDYFKYLKFAFGRTSDIAGLHIRRGRISRTDALRMVQATDGRFPRSYTGVGLRDILKVLGLDESQFMAICDRFTNRALFKTDAQGQLVRREDGSPERLNEP